MPIHGHESEVFGKDGARAKALIGEAQGCTAGFCMGVSLYPSEAYGRAGIHGDHEGFYVLQGEGFAKVGEEEFALRPGAFFVALPGAPHWIRAAPGKGPVKVLWAHGAAGKS